MKKYFKDINGIRVYKTRSEIVITYNGMNTYNPTESMILANGWQEYKHSENEPTEDEILQYEKDNIINEILAYDSSTEVNIFYVNDMPIWLDKATRAGLMLRFQAEQRMGVENTSLWYNNIEFKLPTNIALDLLYAIEMYASKCYDNTQFHIAEISKMTDVDEMHNYDYTSGYPEILRFN